MPIRVSVKVEGSARVTLEDHQIAEIIKRYGVDTAAIEKYVKANFDVDEFTKDIEIEDVSFSRSEWQKLVVDENILSINVKSKNYLESLSLYRTDNVDLSVFQKIDYDAQLLTKVGAFCDFNNPKQELDCLLVQPAPINENISHYVATDTRALCLHYGPRLHDNDLYIPYAFIEQIKRAGGELFVSDAHHQLVLKTDGRFYRFSFDGFKYIDYMRILNTAHADSEVIPFGKYKDALKAEADAYMLNGFVFKRNIVENIFNVFDLDNTELTLSRTDDSTTGYASFSDGKTSAKMIVEYTKAA